MAVSIPIDMAYLPGLIVLYWLFADKQRRKKAQKIFDNVVETIAEGKP